MYTLHSTTIGELKLQVKRSSGSNKRPSHSKKKSRHVSWNPLPNYQCIRKGIPFDTVAQLEKAYAEETVHTSHFYIFEHIDIHVVRNPHVPKYEAAYYITERSGYVLVQKCHMKLAYANDERKNKDLAYTFVSDNDPYWVDRHVACMENEQACKTRYEKKKKSKK